MGGTPIDGLIISWKNIYIYIHMDDEVEITIFFWNLHGVPNPSGSSLNLFKANPTNLSKVRQGLFTSKCHSNKSRIGCLLDLHEI